MRKQKFIQISYGIKRDASSQTGIDSRLRCTNLVISDILSQIILCENYKVEWSVCLNPNPLSLVNSYSSFKFLLKYHFLWVAFPAFLKFG